jgi:HAD superfamily hydrolase (TIGR01509 family)
MKFKSIIFDMDGLLVDSERIWTIVERKILEKRGKVWDIEIQGAMVGMRVSDYVPVMLESYGLHNDTAEALYTELVDSMIAAMYEDLVAKPGAMEIVEYVADKNIPCAIASSSPQELIDAVVDSLGWREILSVHASGEEVENGKPQPDVYLLAAKRMGMDTADCLALEDSPNGARAALAAGMTCYAVPDLEHTKPEKFADITPHVFTTLHDVRAHLSNHS